MTGTFFQFDVESNSTDISPVIWTSKPTDKKEIKQFFVRFNYHLGCWYVEFHWTHHSLNFKQDFVAQLCSVEMTFSESLCAQQQPKSSFSALSLCSDFSLPCIPLEPIANPYFFILFDEPLPTQLPEISLVHLHSFSESQLPREMPLLVYCHIYYHITWSLSLFMVLTAKIIWCAQLVLFICEEHSSPVAVLNDQAVNDLPKPDFMYSKMFVQKLQTLQRGYQNIFPSTTKYNHVIFLLFFIVTFHIWHPWHSIWLRTFTIGQYWAIA